MMRMVLIFIAIGCLSNSVYGQIGDKKKHDLDTFKAFHLRDGLSNFSAKVRNNRKVHVGYFGGSITAATEGWRDLTYNWFRSSFPQTIFTQTNAAIGGTGSDLGVFRVESDVISQSPDLVFMEFAVNDGGKPKEYIKKNVEGIVRKIWKALPTTDICFVYTVDETKCKNLLAGEIDAAVLAMEEIADHYGIPSIHLGEGVVRLLQKGMLVFTANRRENNHQIVFSEDGVHPLPESGHPIYAAQIIRHMPEMMAVANDNPHRLPGAYAIGNREDAKKIALNELQISNSWKEVSPTDELTRKFHQFLPQIYKGVPGSTIKFTFKGTMLGLYDIVGPKSGIWKITVDGETKECVRFDKYCTYTRLASMIVFDELENKAHQVEMEVLARVPDKKAILQGDHLTRYEENPASFEGVACYMGDILILGDVVNNQSETNK